MTSIEFLNGSAKAFETPLVQATQINVPDRDAVAFQFDVPLDGLKPGPYICQINVIDDAGGTFTFPRTAVLIRCGPGGCAGSGERHDGKRKRVERRWRPGCRRGAERDTSLRQPAMEEPVSYRLIH